jgi:glyoxylase-like metal-dependent hydrolase (beta-lactamase superfamily II)
MTQDLRTFTVGDATLSVINIGDVQEDVRGWFGLSAEEMAAHPATFTDPQRLPIQCIHIALPGASILVDAGEYDYPPDSPLLIPGYTPALDLFAGLRQIGVAPASITHVIITHAHGDHFNALTERHDGHPVPAFPNARHYLGGGDWAAMQTALADPASLESRTFGVLHEQGLLTLVDQPTTVVEGVTIVPAPGESPGHQVVRIERGDPIIYCIGDLYHLPVEVEQPHWVVRWNDGPVNQRSRAAFNPQAIEEKALLIATHIVDFGRIGRTESGYTWVAV